MFTLFVIVHVVVAVILVLVVLLQSGKAGDLSTAFGGAGSQTAFGTRSAATLLTKATTVAAVLFMITSLGLSIMSVRGPGGSIMEGVPEQQAPAQQGAPAASQPAAQEPSTPPASPPESQPAPEKPPEQQ